MRGLSMIGVLCAIAVGSAGAAEVVTASPEEFAAIQQRDRERFGAFIREANIRVD